MNCVMMRYSGQIIYMLFTGQRVRIGKNCKSIAVYFFTTVKKEFMAILHTETSNKRFIVQLNPFSTFILNLKEEC